jgi:hypothetical protein
MINLGFLTEGKQAAILIIPSSWGSQQAGYLLHQIGSIKLLFWRRCRGKVEDFCKGSFCTHILYFIIVLLYLFILPASFYIKNPKKLESLVVVISLLLVHHVDS